MKKMLLSVVLAVTTIVGEVSAQTAVDAEQTGGDRQ